MKDIRELLALILLAFFVYALCSGVTVGGKHYGVSDCNGDKGIVVDTGEPVDAGAPEAGRWIVAGFDGKWPVLQRRL